MYSTRSFHSSTRRITVLAVFLLLLPAWFLYGEVRYAENFSISEYDGYTVAEVKQAWLGDDAEPVRYAFISSEAEEPGKLRRQIRDRFPGISKNAVFETPIESLVTLSTTYLPPLLMLDREEALKGVDNGAYVYSPEIRNRIEDGAVVELGSGNQLDMEEIVGIGPDAVMVTGTSGQWNVAPKLRNAGTPVLVNADYLEKTPLGRAEWLKFTALLFDEQEKARREFRSIERRYKELRRKAAGLQDQPKVLLNRPMQDKWVVPGGAGYMAQFVADAGGEYLWSDNESVVSLVRDPEAVFAKALQAEYWLHQYGWTSLADVTAANKSFSRIPAVREEQVVNNDKRVTEKGANDFYESGASRPDRVLADLVKILHPDLLPDHELYYYRYLD